MRIALCYDRVNKIGGAERVLSALHSIWPKAPLYTAVYSPKGAPWTYGWRVIPSFLQKLPFAKEHHEFYPWATSVAFESFSFDDFDIVLSITSAEAKSIVTKPPTIHICYCLTPTRYLWSGSNLYIKQDISPFFNRLVSSVYQKMVPLLRRWDLISSKRPDFYIAISDHVRDRIQRFYNREVVSVIYPPVDTKLFTISKKPSNEFYLLVSRMVHYKRNDIVIEAFNKLEWPLVVVGEGKSKKRLMRLAKPNISFVSSYLTERELVGYYQNCRAFVFAGDEDFGLVAAEAQACGKPVIAYKESGIAEIVKDGYTGILYKEQTVQCLVDALKKSQAKQFSPILCRKNIERFSLQNFRKLMKQAVLSLYSKYSTL